MTRVQRGDRDLPPGPARDLVDLYRRLRSARRVQVRQLASRAGLSASYVSEVLRGWRAPSPEAAKALAVALGANSELASHAGRLAAELAERRATERGRAGHTRVPDVLEAAVMDFGALITERTADFVGRRGPIARLQNRMDQPGARSAYIVVSGEPGIGKTALLARFVEMHGLVHHFNSVLTGITSAEVFLRNVCAQIILKYRLSYRHLPPDAIADSGFLLTLLAQAARRQRVVVAIDAIDESTGPHGLRNRLFLPPALPPGVFVVVTARDPDGAGLYVDERHDLPIAEDDEENLADVQEYIAAFLERHRTVMPPRLAAADSAQQNLIAVLTERSEGNFMYVRHVLQAIRDGALRVPTDQLPRGLQAYYAHLEAQLANASLQAVGPSVVAARQLAILAVLAAWPVPLTAERIAQFAGEQLAVVRGVLRNWNPFLNRFTTDGQPTYALYHASFRDFLAERLDMTQVRSRIEDAVEADLP